MLAASSPTGWSSGVEVAFEEGGSAVVHPSVAGRRRPPPLDPGVIRASPAGVAGGGEGGYAGTDERSAFGGTYWLILATLSLGRGDNLARWARPAVLLDTSPVIDYINGTKTQKDAD